MSLQGPPGREDTAGMSVELTTRPMVRLFFHTCSPLSAAAIQNMSVLTYFSGMSNPKSGIMECLYRTHEQDISNHLSQHKHKVVLIIKLDSLKQQTAELACTGN